MPPSSRYGSPKPTLTQKQVDLLTCVMTNLKSQPEVDWDAVASQGKFANKASAKEVYRQMRIKLGWPTSLSTGSPSSSPSSSAAAAGAATLSAKTPTKVSKRSNPQAHRAATKATVRKKAAFAERQAAHDGEKDEGEKKQKQQEEEDYSAEV